MSQPIHSKNDLYCSITQHIASAIEAGAETFTFPWHSVPGLPQNITSGRSYRGINTLLLWLTGHSKGYATPYWATFKQWRELGHPVRKGEKSTTIVFWKQLTPGAQAESEDAPEGRAFVARAYHVFNAAQVEGFTPPGMPVLPESERIARA